MSLIWHVLYKCDNRTNPTVVESVRHESFRLSSFDRLGEGERDLG